jgi:hypothetical protein
MSAVIFKRTKSKPAQRSRQHSPDADPESRVKDEDSPSVLATRLKKRDRPKSKLSFGVHDEVRVILYPSDLCLINLKKGGGCRSFQGQEV